MERVHSWLAEREGSSWGWVVTGGRPGIVVLEEVGGEGWGQSPEGHMEGMSLHVR